MCLDCSDVFLDCSDLETAKPKTDKFVACNAVLPT